MVSDASKMESNATYAWAIADYEDVLCSNTGIVCGCKESITSYRAEAFGVLSLVTFLWRLFRNYDKRAKKLTFTIYCDNKSVIKTTASPSEADADQDVFLQLQWVLHAIRHCLSVEFLHVKGHQLIDDDSPREARLNHWCNGEAKQRARALHSFESQQHLHFPAAQVTLSKDGSVGRVVTPWFRENLTRPALQKYFQDKYMWDNNTMASIDWSAYESAHQGLNQSQKTTMIKFRTHWIATRSRLFLLQQSPTSICPCCRTHEETWEHVLKCPSQIGAHAKLFHSLQNWMRDKETPLKLHLLIIRNLRQALDLPHSSLSPLSNASEALQQFHVQQNSIGWASLFCGFASKSLAWYIDTQLPPDSDESGNQWVVGLLRHLQKWVTSTWLRRCKLEHNKLKEEQSATRQHLLQRIHTLYEQRHKVPFHFQKCFDMPMQSFTQKSDNFLSNWLVLHEEVLHRVIATPLKQSCMLDFFSPG